MFKPAHTKILSSNSWRPSKKSNSLIPTNATVTKQIFTLPYHNSVINILKSSINPTTTTAIHSKIIKLGYETSSSLSASLISSYITSNRHNFVQQLIRQIPISSFDLITLNSIISGFMKIGDHEFARKVFDKMPERDVVSWNCIINGYVRNSLFDEGLRLFKQMMNIPKIEPDGFTFVSIISGIAKLGALVHAKWVHDLIIEKQVGLNFILNSALIDMYAKCGRINTAKEVFHSVKRDHVSIWNAMINGLAIHGLALEAIKVFSEMSLENILPDSITFVGILKACSHCGLVEEGRICFDRMSNKYSIQPELEHYGAMVDLYARSGLLEEAHAVIKTMPVNPDVVIWRAILSACRTYKNPELGELAIANISNLESGDYVLLSNAYCSMNKWESAQKVREKMKTKKVHKIRAKSWVEIGNVIHQFKAGDQSHYEIESVYKTLESMLSRIKMQGFVSSTELVLMDVSEEEKEANLNVHSEKLALAYGILRTSPGVEIRISKNLRTCYDCHAWMKMVSKVLNRVIVVRDRIRFHLFDGGVCSCKDYW